MILNIRKDGLDAWLENTIHPEYPPQKLCESSWQDSGLSILKNLEEAVYQSPRLLDDFATRIVIYDSHTLFVPVEFAEESADSEAELYNSIYESAPNDIMTETRFGLTAIWSIGSGVREFLLRTFPGARLTCNLMEKVADAMQNNGGYNLKAEIRENETDVVLVNGDKLLAASTRERRKKSEVEDFIREVVHAYDLKPGDVATEIVDLTEELV